MEFELPKINVSFEYDEEKDEIVFVINGVEKRVKIEDMITEMENLQEQNIALEQESCDDCISRKEVIQIINDFSYKNEHEETLINERIKNLPSIQPKPKTGHWINKYHEVFKYYCDKCGTGSDLRTPYCPNCGAKMESEE